MSRLARVVAVDCPHHVTQRGNYRQQTFFCDEDYRLYLELLTDYSRQYSLELWGYCLMPNHVHVIAVPRESTSLARAFGRTHSDYARAQHIRLRRIGHLWQARFYSCPLDETSQWPALAYVERNALRAGLVETADAWRWSSAATHCGSGNKLVALELAAWRKWYDAERWRQVLATSVVEEAISERIREATVRGTPRDVQRDSPFFHSDSGRQHRLLRRRDRFLPGGSLIVWPPLFAPRCSFASALPHVQIATYRPVRRPPGRHQSVRSRPTFSVYALRSSETGSIFCYHSIFRIVLI